VAVDEAMASTVRGPRPLLDDGLSLETGVDT
jgi:hypothetical protein